MKRTDTPDVVALPPLLYLGAFLLSLLLQWLRPWPLSAHPALLWLGVASIAAGATLLGWGSWTMHRAGTNIPPNRPATVLVSDGPFRYTRNPLYVGLHLVFLGLACALNTLWGLVVFVPLALVMHYGVILREERYLAARFGEAYEAYRARVRRYL